MVALRASALALLTATLALGMLPPASANHMQSDSGRIIVFDHVTGNEWWVEVGLSGQDAGSVVSVEAMDTNGPWVALQKKSWGPYAASFHIEPGNQVRFRASWAGGAQQVSCWFTHPAGLEQCAPAPTLWPTTVVGDAGNPPAGGGDLAIGDADNDGRRDVTIGDGAGIFTFENAAGSWGRQRIGATTGVEALAVGDGDGDGQREVYAMSNGNLVQARFLNGAWTERVVLALPQNPNPAGGTSSGDMTLGNIDGVAGPELYVALGHVDCDPAGQSGCSTTSYIYRVAFESGTWRGTQVSTSGGNIRSMWIGDGDSDGDAELYVGRSSSHAEGKVQVQKVNGVWQTNDLPGDVGTGSQLVVGDVDRDGRSEVYTASFTGDIGLISYAASTGWTHRVITTLAGAEPDNLFIGDADNDGRQDLYVGQSGDVTQVRYDAGQWKPAVVARLSVGTVSMLVVGDGDGDARNEAYAGALSGQGTSQLTMRVVRIGEAARTTGAFDATFTGVRGNEWWVQANVATNGPAIAKVDVRLFSNNAWGSFMPVARQSWGWGSSYHIVQGTVVQLRATASDGQTDLSSCRQWVPAPNTDAAIVACPGSSPPPPPAFDATFTGVKANEWWIQANVAGNEPIAAVHFRVNCAPQWSPLTKQSWGGWAPTYQVHFNEGDKVDFKATSADGDSDASGGYVMRAATATSGCALGTWPVAGSRVVYNMDSGVCGGGECFDAAGTLTLTYQGDNGWDGVCVGRNTHTATDGTQTHEDWVGGALDITPLFTKVPTSVGATHGLRQLGVFYSAKSCGVTGVDTLYTVERQEMRPTALVDANHNPIVLSQWVADRDMPEENFLEASWDSKLGMVLETHSYPRRSQQGDANLYVTLTDAPLR